MHGLIETQILACARDGDLAGVRALTREYDLDDVNLDADGNSLLGVAVLFGHWELAGYLMEQGFTPDIEVHHVDFGWRWPLELAMKAGRWDVVREVVASGAKLSLRAYYNYLSPLAYFASQGDLTMVNNILAPFVSEGRARYATNFARAFGNGDTADDYIEDACMKIVNYPEHYPPIILAARHGHKAIVDRLLEYGARTDFKASMDGCGAPGSELYTAVQNAAMFGHNEIVLNLMRHHTYDPGHADTNMGLSLDLFGHREAYGAYLDMNRVVEVMTGPAATLAQRQDYRADLLMLQAAAKRYASTRAVPKFRGARAEVAAQSDDYLARARIALEIIGRSKVDPSLLPPSDRPGIDRVAALQKLMLMCFCTSIATYVRNHPDVDLSNPGWQAIARLGLVIDARSDRGYFYGTGLVRLDMGRVFDVAFDDIIANIGVVRAFVADHANLERLRELQGTALYQLACFCNDCEQLTKLLNNHTWPTEANLTSGDEARIAAALNSVAVVLELATQHLSPMAQAYFHDVDSRLLASIRNHLRHVNGSNRVHSAYAPVSRARRFAKLSEEGDSSLRLLLQGFMSHDVAELIERGRAYAICLSSMRSWEDIRAQFVIDDAWHAPVRRYAWSYWQFGLYRRHAAQLYAYLDASDTRPLAPEIEGALQRHLRAATEIGFRDNDHAMRQWCARVRVQLGLTGNNIRRIPRPRRDEVRASVRASLPILTDPAETSLASARRLYFYLSNALNIRYAIASLEQVAATRTQLLEGKVGVVIAANAIEWHTVHFYEHAAEFIGHPVFRGLYEEAGGDTAVLMADMEQIRNYIAHGANPLYLTRGLRGVDHARVQIDFSDHAKRIAGCLRKVNERCQAVYDELVSLAPDLLPEKINTAMNGEAESKLEGGGHTVRNALIIAGAAIVIGVGGYYAWRQSEPDVSMVPECLEP